ncbi:hypothetical protein [Campylobacter sp. RM16188]|uniref:hypothetical protein n=1 Tax=Campylobacter sp. RM16188 TaxID=1705725 RepID=UPI001555666D|nr:hypothetical protein [Campylobacter sp. RM16188]
MNNSCMVWLWNERSKMFKGVICRKNGGFNEIGKILLKYYNNPLKIKKLLDLGSLNEVGTTVNDSFPYYDNGDNITISKAKDLESIGKFNVANHYFFVGDCWFVKKGFFVKKLKEVLA